MSFVSGDALYWFLRRALDVLVWGGELVGDWELPPAGPAVFVANHAGALGPIAVAASLPVRLHPWIVGDMLDAGKSAPYLLQDFVKPELHLADRLGMPLSQALSRVTVPLLRNLGCIPVWQERELLETYRVSEEALVQGRSLLVFPEDPALPIDSRTGMRPFKTGFAHLGRLHFDRSGEPLNFYPIAVHRPARRVRLGPPIAYNPLSSTPSERRRIAHSLEAVIAAMLAEPAGRVPFSVHATP